MAYTCGLKTEAPKVGVHLSRVRKLLSLTLVLRTVGAKARILEHTVSEVCISREEENEGLVPG